MNLHWREAQGTSVIDQVTDFRLTRHAGHYPAARDDLWWSAAISLKNTSIAAFEHAIPEEFRKDFLIPDDYTKADRAAMREDQVVTIYARSALLRLLNSDQNKAGVTSVHLGNITPREHLHFGSARSKEPVIDVPEGTVVMAVIDGGIAFANDLFRSEPLSTRVEHVSILACKPDPPGGATVGRKLDKVAIDRLLDSCTTSGLLDEDLFYRKAGLIDFSDGTFQPAALRRSHGTHIMGLAAGYPMGKAPKTRPIICAILPPQITEDVTGQSLLPSLKLAMKRLYNQASCFRLPNKARPPVVCNFSYGNNDGPHDGTDRIPTLIENYCVGGPPFGPPIQETRMVLPAGNANLMRIHAELNRHTVSRKSKHQHPSWKLDLMILPDDRTSSLVQMWTPCNPSTGVVRVRVTTPGGKQSGWVAAGDGSYQSLRNAEGQEIARLSYTGPRKRADRGVFILNTSPTFSLKSAELAPSGRWRIDVEVARPGEWAKDDAIRVWVARDETLPGFRPGGRQAFFDNADYKRFDSFGAPLPVDPVKPPDSECPVRRAGTLNGFACGDAPLVIAALTRSNGLLSDYSAAGPGTPSCVSRNKPRTGPDAAAKGDESPALPGILSAGSRSGSFVRMGGTSVAAPRVARFVADAIASGAPGDRAWLWEAAESQDTHYKTPKPAASRTGGGRLDISVDLGPITSRKP